MTRMTRPDCAVMCNLINTHTHTYTHTHQVTRSFIAETRSQSGGTAPDGAGIPVVLPDQLNERQRQAFGSVKKHHDADDGGALRMLVLGTAGPGGSWLVYTLSNLLGAHVRRVAPTGMAAFPIGGNTFHSLLCLPVRGGKDLQGDSLKKLQARLTSVKYIIIDELSMVSQVQMAWIDRRLCQATGKTTEPLEGMSVIMTGTSGSCYRLVAAPCTHSTPRTSSTRRASRLTGSSPKSSSSTKCSGKTRQKRKTFANKGSLTSCPELETAS